MGLDITVVLLCGYKIKLSDVFESGLIDSEIMSGDEWQFLDEDECKVEVLEFILCPKLKQMLNSSVWKGYILSSTQSECDWETSYLYIYNNREMLYYGCVPDHANGVVSVETADNIPIDLDVDCGPYAIHWVVSGSW